MVPGSTFYNLQQINFGSGGKTIPGYLSLDMYHDADIKEDIRTVTFPPNTLGHCICLHTIEHLTLSEGLKFLKSCQEWIAPGYTLTIETPDREKCLKVARLKHTYRDRHMVLRSSGGCGLMGGISFKGEDRVKYHNWILKNIDLIVQLVEAFHHVPPEYVPDNFKRPGEQHLWLWTGEELKMVMERMGFTVSIQSPQSHGRREWRDCRVTGVKR